MENLKTKTIAEQLLVVLMSINTFTSCIMDKQTNIYVKNCTKDSLLIKLTRTDSLVDWQSWNRSDGYDMSQNDTRVTDNAFLEAVANSLALPNETIRIDPYALQRYDSCYIYAIKLSVAKNYSMDDIRTKKLYDRQVVTKKHFHDYLFEFRQKKIMGTDLK